MPLDAAIVRNPTAAALVTGLPCVLGSFPGSTFPTIAEINASSHLNQAIALYNRRTNQAMASPDVFSYLTPGPLLATDMVSLRTKVDTLRTCFGLGGFAWTHSTASIISGATYFATDLQNLFSALNFSSAFTQNIGSSQVAIKEEQQHPAGTTSAGYPITITPPAGVFGSFAGFYSNETLSGGTPQDINYRNRGGFFVIIPNYSGLANPSNATLIFFTNAWTNGLGAYTPVVYSSNSDDSSFSSGWWNNKDNFIGNLTYGAASTTMSISGSIIAARFGGGHMSFLFGHGGEFNGIATPTAPVNTANNSQMQFDPSGTSKITFDYGF